MQPPTVGIEVGHDFKGRDFCLESLGILQVFVPNLVDDIAEEFGNATFGYFVAGIVVEARFVGGLGANTDDSHGVVGNVPVAEGEAGRPDKLGGAMAGFILGGLLENGRERMAPSNWSYGMTMRRGRRVSQIASRLLSVGCPLRGGEVPQASLRRQVIASAFMLVGCCRDLLTN